MSFSGLGLFYETDESREGVQAFSENRPPDYAELPRPGVELAGRRAPGVELAGGAEHRVEQPGKRCSSSSRRSEFSRVVPSSR